MERNSMFPAIYLINGESPCELINDFIHYDNIRIHSDMAALLLCRIKSLNTSMFPNNIWGVISRLSASKLHIFHIM